MQFSGKFWLNIRLALPLGLGTPLGNPASAPGKDYLTHRFENVQIYIIFYGSDNPVGIIQSLTLKQISSFFSNTGDCDVANRRVQSISMVWFPAGHEVSSFSLKTMDNLPSSFCLWSSSSFFSFSFSALVNFPFPALGDPGYTDKKNICKFVLIRAFTYYLKILARYIQKISKEKQKPKKQQTTNQNTRENIFLESIRKQFKYQGVKEFHMLARIGSL